MTDKPTITCRFATDDDAPLVARMNKQLIEDERHRNSMSVSELTERLRHWLSSGYQVVLFEYGQEVIGYVLFRREPEHVYVRQFFIAREHRRQGIGREAIEWLRRNVWRDAPRLRLDVLVGNAGAIAFWRSVGFDDYCLTMEAEM